MSDELEKSLETVAKGGSILFLGTITGIFLAMVNQVLLGRFLGVENYGLFYLAFTIVNVSINFTTLGLYGSLPRFLPFHHSQGERNLVRSAIRFSQLLVIGIGILFSVIVYLFSRQIAVNIFHNETLTIALQYFAIGIPLLSLATILEAIVRSLKAVRLKVIIFDIGIWIVRLIVFIPFLVVGYTLFGAIISYLIAIGFTIFIPLIYLKKIFSKHSTYQRIPVAKQLLSFSWPLFIASVVMLFVSKMDVLLLGYFLSNIEVGLYVPSLIIASYVTIFASPFAYIFLPVVSELFGKAKKENIESLFKTASKWIFLMVLPVFIYILIFPKEIISIIYGPEFSSRYLALVILAMGISMNTFTGMTGGILVGGGYTKLNLIVEIIAAVICVSLCASLIPLYGLIGAAIGVSASYFGKNIISLIFVYRTTKMHAFNKRYLGIVSSGVIIFIIFYFLKYQFLSFFTSWIFVILAGIILLCLYLLLLFVFRCFDEQDKFFIKLLIKRLKILRKITDKFF